jgi:hypothetical protein
MRLVVRRVEVLSVPAGREENLGPETTRTMRIVGESRGLLFRRTIEVDADRVLGLVIVKV